MAVTTEVETFSAELTDSYGIEIWQFRKRFEYTVDEARSAAAEIVAACDEADRCLEEDRITRLQRMLEAQQPRLVNGEQPY